MKQPATIGGRRTGSRLAVGDELDAFAGHVAPHLRKGQQGASGAAQGSMPSGAAWGSMPSGAAWCQQQGSM